jgi:hypothetical protein
MRTWRKMKRSPPSHAAARASKPTTKPVHDRLVQYISTQAGAIAKKTAPTNLARKLEKLVIR